MNKNRNRISIDELIIFTDQLRLTIESDLSITEGLNIISEKSNNKELKNRIEQMLEDLYSGERFTESIKKHKDYFSEFYVNMIEIGEDSGDMASIFRQLIVHYNREKNTKEKIRQALIYPSILAVLMFSVIIFIIIAVMPMFETVLLGLGGNMPPITRGVLKVSLFLKSYGILILLILLGLVLGLKYYFKSPKGKKKYDKLLFKLPIVRDIFPNIMAARFAANLGLLIKSSQNVSRSFAMIKTVMENDYIEGKIKIAEEKINQGMELDMVIEDMELFPDLLIKLFSIGVKTGKIEETLFKAADEMDKQVDNKLSRIVSLIEPVIITLLSLIVGLILISMIMPVLDIMNSIN